MKKGFWHRLVRFDLNLKEFWIVHGTFVAVCYGLTLIEKLFA